MYVLLLLVKFQSLKSSPQSMADVPLIPGNIILTHDLFLRAKSSIYVIKETTKFSHGDKKRVCFLMYTCSF